MLLLCACLLAGNSETRASVLDLWAKASAAVPRPTRCAPCRRPASDAALAALPSARPSPTRLAPIAPIPLPAASHQPPPDALSVRHQCQTGHPDAWPNYRKPMNW